MQKEHLNAKRVVRKSFKFTLLSMRANQISKEGERKERDSEILWILVRNRFEFE